MNTSKLLSSWFLVTVVVASLGASGCEKSADLGRMQEETLGIVKLHATEIEVLQRRADALMARGRNLGGDATGIAEAGRLLSEARAGLDQLRAQLAAAPSTLGNAVKGGEVEEVQRSSDELIEKLDRGEVTVKANLAAVDNWLMNAENRASTMSVPAPPAPVVKEQPAPGFSTKLSTGVEITGNADGIEHALLAFVQDTARAVDKTSWFEFDRLVFETGKATLDADKSREQLANVDAILAAYPAVRLKIGGYTDNTGKAEDNQRLSQQRAEIVRAALVAGGVKADRLEAEGYGAGNPVCPANDSDACRAKNRRIAVRVTAK